MTGESLEIYKSIKHDVVNFVDDSSNSIGGDTLNDVKKYTEKFIFIRLHCFMKLLTNTCTIFSNSQNINCTLGIKMPKTLCSCGAYHQTGQVDLSFVLQSFVVGDLFEFTHKI